MTTATKMNTEAELTSYLNKLNQPNDWDIYQARCKYLEDASLRNLVNFAYEQAAGHKPTGANMENQIIFCGFVHYYLCATKWIKEHTTSHTADEVLEAVEDSEKLAKIKADLDEIQALEKTFAEWAKRAKGAKVFGFPIVAA